MSRVMCMGIVLSLSAQTAWGASFAGGVVSYSAGGGVGAAYRNPDRALGPPSPLTGESGGFAGVLSPFSPAFEPDELVQVGPGGQITLRMQRWVIPTDGPEIGVIENVGLVDAGYPQGRTGNPVATFLPSEDSALVEASEDGQTWAPVAGGAAVVFQLPAMYYLNAGPYDSVPPAAPVLADFGLPFTPPGGLAGLAGLEYSQLVAAFAGSGGGTWLDLSSTGLPRIAYLRFSLPAGADWTLDLDAVSIADAAAGPLLPEPSTLALLVAAAGCGAAVRRRRRGTVAARRRAKR